MKPGISWNCTRQMSAKADICHRVDWSGLSLGFTPARHALRASRLPKYEDDTHLRFRALQRRFAPTRAKNFNPEVFQCRGLRAGAGTDKAGSEDIRQTPQQLGAHTSGADWALRATKAGRKGLTPTR